MQHSALSGNRDSIESLALELLTHLPGERLPTVLQYQEQLGIGSGTVQARMRVLEDAGIIRLRARGHQGTYLVERNLGELWNLCRLGALRGVLPIPEALEPTCLAVVIRRQFEELKIPLELRYSHGSSARVQMVREGGADFAVLSARAAAEATTEDGHVWNTLSFGPQTYHRDEAMVVIVRPTLAAADKIVRIGIDPESFDHSLMTRAEFPPHDGYEYCDYPHAALPAAVAEGVIDAAIWHNAPLPIPLSAVGIGVRPLRRPEAIVVVRELGYAVLLAATARPELASVLAALDLSKTRDVQEEGLSSDTLPLYWLLQIGAAPGVDISAEAGEISRSPRDRGSGTVISGA